MKQGVTHLSGLLGALLLLASGAKGQGRPPTSADLAAARELFADAAELEAHSEWSAAAAKLKSALAIKETPGLRYHLAHCEEQLDAFVEAAADYERAAELIRAGNPAPDVEPLLPLAQRRLDSRIAKLDLVVPAGTAAAAELDGRALPASAIGTSIRLDPGIHHVVVRADGHGDFRADVSLAVGEHRTLKVFFPEPARRVAAAAPAPLPAPLASPRPSPPSATEPTEASRPPPPPAPDRRGSSGVRTALLVGEATVTAVGLGLGIGFGVARPAAARRVYAAQASVPENERACSDTPSAACTQLLDLINAYHRDVGWETAGFVGAGVGAGLFAATWLLWPSTRKAAALTVEPAVQGAILSARGAF